MLFLIDKLTWIINRARYIKQISWTLINKTSVMSCIRKCTFLTVFKILPAWDGTSLDILTWRSQNNPDCPEAEGWRTVWIVLAPEGKYIQNSPNFGWKNDILSCLVGENTECSCVLYCRHLWSHTGLALPRLVWIYRSETLVTKNDTIYSATR